MKLKYTKSILLSFLLFFFITSCDNTTNKKENVKDKEAEVTFTRNDAEKKVDVFIKGKYVTTYIYPNSIKKPVLYPVKTLSGKRITRGFPFEAIKGERVDHPHQVGLWFTYGDVNGLDFWNNSDSIKMDKRDKYGTILHKEIKNIQEGEIGTLEVRMDWVDINNNVLLEENTKFIFTPGTHEYSVNRITNLTAVEDVDMKDNKEGVLGIRTARELEHPSDKPEIFTDANGISTGVPAISNEGVVGNYLNSNDVEGMATWGKRADWVNLRSKIKDEEISLVIIDHKENPGYPTYWHARGYGLFAANPLGQEQLSNGVDKLNFKLNKGESVTFRHKIIIASKKLSSEELNKRFEEFSKTKN